MENPTLAQRALSAVLDMRPGVAILDSWTDGTDVICLLYRGGPGQIIGLRRRIESDVPLHEVVEEIVYIELDEPRGTRGMTMGPDGVLWWSGNPESERSYNWGRKGQGEESGSMWARLARRLRTS